MRGRIGQVAVSVFAAWALVSIAGCSGKDETTAPDDRSVPVVATAAVGSVTDTSAQCGGTVTSAGGEPVTARGVCWSAGPTPTVSDNKTVDGSGTGSFTSSLTGLTPDTPYHARAYATNGFGTGYGEIRTFKTEPAGGTTGTVTDIDGNVYRTVKIGDRWWMAENLRVTHFRDGTKCPLANAGAEAGGRGRPTGAIGVLGDEIPLVADPGAWSTLTSAGCCAYGNNADNASIYGLLYNWYAVKDSRGIAPVGWHVPSDDELQMLIEIVGGESVAGGALKESGTAHWGSPNTGTDQFGFTALPGGYRLINGDFKGLGTNALFWSSTEDPEGFMPFAWYRSIFNSTSNVLRLSDSQKIGMSVRCVRD